MTYFGFVLLFDLIAGSQMGVVNAEILALNSQNGKNPPNVRVAMGMGMWNNVLYWILKIDHENVGGIVYRTITNY